MIQKTLAVLVAIAIFCLIFGTPFYMWESQSVSGNATGMDFLLGMTGIIWMPLLAMVAWFISAFVARLLWPKK